MKGRRCLEHGPNFFSFSLVGEKMKRNKCKVLTSVPVHIVLGHDVRKVTFQSAVFKNILASMLPDTAYFVWLNKTYKQAC